MRDRPALARVAATFAVACCTLTVIAAAMAPAATAVAAADDRVGGAAPVASGDTWGTAVLVPGSAVLNKGGFGNVNSISWAAPGDCAAAGSYDSSLDNQAFVADEKAGTWRTAREVPGTAALNKFSANALSVSCASSGNCAVGGFYEDASQNSEAGGTSPIARAASRLSSPTRIVAAGDRRSRLPPA